MTGTTGMMSAMSVPDRIGRFVVTGQAGGGGFATVYRAQDETLQSAVAIKVLAANWAHDRAMHDRFIAEARLLRRADSDRVVRVHDVGDLPDGRPYLVMTFADRGTLHERLAPGAVPWQTAVGVAVEIALGLQVLHEADILHRDIKPSNVLFRGQPGGREQLLLGDLGLGRLLTEGAVPTLVAGTPGYMAPEQGLVGAPVSVRTDVFAVGAVLFRALTGRGPGEPDVVVYPGPLSTVAPTQLVPGLPPALDHVVLRCMARDPEHRYPDVRSLLTELRQAGRTPGPTQVVGGTFTAPYTAVATAAAHSGPSAAHSGPSTAAHPGPPTAAHSGPSGPASGPQKGPQNGPQSGPQNGPQQGAQSGPQRGFPNGPHSRPLNAQYGPQHGPPSGPQGPHGAYGTQGPQGAYGGPYPGGHPGQQWHGPAGAKRAGRRGWIVASAVAVVALATVAVVVYAPWQSTVEVASDPAGVRLTVPRGWAGEAASGWNPAVIGLEDGTQPAVLVAASADDFASTGDTRPGVFAGVLPADLEPDPYAFLDAVRRPDCEETLTSTLDGTDGDTDGAVTAGGDVLASLRQRCGQVVLDDVLLRRGGHLAWVQLKQPAGDASAGGDVVASVRLG
jgi:serine/threonine protein kinase